MELQQLLISPLVDYVNIPIYQEFPSGGDYFTNAEERVYLDLRASNRYTSNLEKLKCNDSNVVLRVNVKTTVTKKMRLRVWGYSPGEYLYLLTEFGLTMKYKTYSIVNKEDITS